MASQAEVLPLPVQSGMEKPPLVKPQRKTPGAMAGDTPKESSTGMQPPKKRTKAHSCDSCRRRKLKCDRGWPCGACRDRNEEHLCTWEEGVVPERVGRDAPDNVVLLQRLSSLESKFDKLMNKLDSVAKDPANASVGTQPSAPHEPSTILEMNESTHERPDALIASCTMSMFFQPTDLPSRRQALLRMLHYLPKADVLQTTLDAFSFEMQWISCIIDKQYVQGYLDDVLFLQNELQQKSDFVTHIDGKKLSRYIYSVASCLAICAMSVAYSREKNLDTMHSDQKSQLPYQRYIYESLMGLSSLPVFDEPDMNFVVIMVMIVSCLCFTRSPGIASSMIANAVQVAFLLDMDVEPPSDMSYVDASRRVQLYNVLCTQDWFTTMMIKRYPLIPFDKERMPSVFGSAEQRAKYLSPYQQLKLNLAHLYCRSSPLIMPRNENYEYVKHLHEEAFEIMSLFPSMWVGGDEGFKHMSPSWLKLHRMIGLGALHYLLLRIHLPFYLRGWNDSNFTLSRDTCYNSSRSLLHLFREAFSWKVRKTSTGNPSEALVPDEISVPARMWYFGHWCTAAALLLLKHLTMLNERNDQQSWDPERESLVEDLCIMSRLFQYLLPISNYAREGYDAMQRVASHALRRDNDAAQLKGENCVAHWADRIMPHRSHTQGDEPMSVLHHLSKHPNFAHFEEKSVPKRKSSERNATPVPQGTPTCGTLSNAQSSPTMSNPSSSASMSHTPTISDTDFDTFWAKFAGPVFTDSATAKQPTSQGADNMSILPEPSMFLMPSQQPPPMRLDADMALMFQQELFDSDPMNMGTNIITPFADEFLRSMDYPSTTDLNSTAPPTSLS